MPKDIKLVKFVNFHYFAEKSLIGHPLRIREYRPGCCCLNVLLYFLWCFV
ncbi:hypothetical protein HanXRQr2_Chr17g0813401 [Helianthus annuus]|uniref:Uncharacterized protein n=1 Tax=Helianthus annuus TaxID=4232 RepID=A0A9K3DLJ1_HELAN|nr:hypothetical protein HanXRQr2_Chr17g0813401 [Helianthus annuus]